MPIESIRGNEDAVRNISGLYHSRMARGLTQKELSQLSGVGLSTIGGCETGIKFPNIRTYNKLCKVFGWEQIVVSKPKAKSKTCTQSYARLEDLPPPKHDPVKIPCTVKFEFEEGHCYTITDSLPTKNIRHFQAVHICVFRYEGKQGIHHIFREVSGNWTRTYTDAQLIGKKIKEVEE